MMQPDPRDSTFVPLRGNLTFVSLRGNLTFVPLRGNLDSNGFESDGLRLLRSEVPFPAAVDALDEARRFALRGQREIEAATARLGFTLRLATLADIPTIQAVQEVCFRCKPEQLMNDQSLYRIVQFGYAVLLDDGAGRLVGYNLILPIADHERSALGSGLAVLPEMEGRGLGQTVARYASLEAMANGARVRRGTVKPGNHASLKVLLNKCGAICEHFHRRFGCHGESRFQYRLPLTPGGMTPRPIEPAALARFAADATPGRDVRVISGDELDELEALYDNTAFRVVAVAPAGLLASGPRLVAVPVTDLDHGRIDHSVDLPRCA